MAIVKRDFPTLEGCAAAIAVAMGEALGHGIERRGEAVMALSGGRTPRHIFPLLAKQRLDWSKVTLTLVDERWVDPSHPDSNENLVREFLLAGAARAAKFVPLKTKASTPEQGIGEAEANMDRLSWPLEAIFLGLGEDGHIASFFPGEGIWEEAAGRCVAVPADGSRLARISLSGRALLDCRRIYLLFAGANKGKAFAAALNPGPIGVHPLRLVLGQEKVPVFVYAAE
ncbi:MAG TPA: 6-phosphogluconolactonase [Rhodospirillales bacterium]|jgi:6-phosphogluconolactonase|nr:6-phosphogluconolactonase [Rhodospirillales bacterium]